MDAGSDSLGAGKEHKLRVKKGNRREIRTTETFMRRVTSIQWTALRLSCLQLLYSRIDPQSPQFEMSD
jgi:hypothetical protein